MQIYIESSQILVSTALKEFIDSKLQSELTSCRHRVRKVHAYLCDIDGKHGGSDTRCRLVIRLNQAREIIVESTEANLYSAVTRSAKRMRRTIARNIAKKPRFNQLQALPMMVQNQSAPAA